MSFTLVGSYFPLDERANAIGWIIAGMSFSYLVGAPIIGFISGFGGWRLAFIGYVLPISLLGLFFAFVGLPPESNSQHNAMGRRQYLEGFMRVFSNRSAIACLVATSLSVAAYQAMVFYGPSFFRQRFLMSTGLTSLMILGSSIIFITGTRLSGRFANRFGKKPLVVSTALLAGIFIVSYTNLPSLWLSLAARFLGSFFTGLMYTASSSLTLEQVPRFRGTMMSINSAAHSIGADIGSGVGGFVLLLYDYGAIGASLGAMMVAASIIFYIIVIDPTRTQLLSSESE